MRHHKRHGMKLGTDASHTKAIKRSLVCSLLENDRIKTTLPKAKAIRRDVDRIITFAKKGTLHARRLAIAQINNAELVRETFEKAEQGMWQDRNGGYTRILKLGKRKGDNAEIAIVELVQEPVKKAAAKKDGDSKTKVEKVAASSSAAKKSAGKKDASGAKADAETDKKKPAAAKANAAKADKVKADKAEAKADGAKADDAKAKKADAKADEAKAEKVEKAEKAEAEPVKNEDKAAKEDK